MKLISCDIENFGGLHRCHLDFKPGLNVIREENGFGKTTLAEFIRAMFYGFPGRGGRTVDKNSRKKYTPWQGGVFGGSLVFEHDGKTYRIDRSFGQTAKGDSFSLFDAETMQKSRDFTENIGLELFQLNSDSFERSTYLPQLHSGSCLTTDAIQAKLGDLVDDTNDVNNYEKAITALRAKRSLYIPYRGKGGSVAQAQSNISSLQLELALSGSLRQELAEAIKDARSLREEAAQLEARRTAVRSRITQAAQAEADRALLGQYQAMLQKQDELHRQLEDLHRTYPRGLPGGEELEQIEALFDGFPAIAKGLTMDEGLQADEACLRANQARFSQGLPTPEDLQQRQQECRDYISAEIAWSGAALSEAESRQLDSLLDFFCGEEPPVDAWIDCAREQLEQLNQLCSQQTALQKLAPVQDPRLKTFFASGLPQEEELRQQAQALQSLNRLREENARLAAAAAPQTPQKKSPLPLILLSAGLLVMVFGIFMLGRHSFVPGGIAMALGAAGLMGAVYLSLRQTLSRTVSGSPQPAIAGKLREREQEMAQLEQTLACFTARFPTESAFLPEQLAEIQSKAESFTAMIQAASRHEAQCQALNDEIDALAQSLSTRLEPYFQSSFDDTLSALRLNRERLESLRQKQADQTQRRAQLQERMQTLAASLTAFLEPLCGEISPQDFGSALDQLQRDCDRYTAARQRLTLWHDQAAAQKQALEKSSAALERFCQRYGLTLSLSDRSGLRTLVRDVSQQTILASQFRQNQQECEQFRQAHAAVLTLTDLEEGPALPQLKEEEEYLTESLTQLSDRLLKQNQTVSSLQNQVDGLPEKEDALDAWKAKKEDEQRRCSLLDQTISFMEEAKEKLSGSYLGTLRSRFTAYAQSLLGLRPEELILTPDLEVKLDRQGHPRELEYFSAGQTDLLTLCMRLALVDALFKEVSPFLILDDPFVNLDDCHMAQALTLLQQLTAQHQILYLVCNSSRCPQT